LDRIDALVVLVAELRHAAAGEPLVRAAASTTRVEALG
jgi:hypothetical protein